MVAQASSSRTAPSADSLAFSANIFTSQIDSWIPANFGTSYQPPSESLNNVPDQDGNLGIGHPSLDVPKHKRQDHGAGQLEKMLGLNKKGKGRAEDGVSTIKKEEVVEDEEEEESRGSIGKKRKVGTIDLLAGKKKAKAKMKAQSLAVGSSPTISATATATKTQNDESNGTGPSITKKTLDHTETTTPTTSQDTPKSTPIPTPSTSSPNTTLTKNQRKNLRKKQKKAAASGIQE
jgi:hypothetical protein